MSSLGEKITNNLANSIRQKVYNAMAKGFEQLQRETNKDSGRAAAGWVMTVEEEDVSYVPERYKDAQKISVNGHQDSRYVGLQNQHKSEADNIKKNVEKTNVFQITNNVEYVNAIDYAWNPGFFERAVDTVRMNLENDDGVSLSWQGGMDDNVDIDDGGAF